MRLQACVFASLVVALTGATVTSAQTAPIFQFTEEPGPYQVGLKVVEQYDYSRVYRPSTDQLGKPYLGERARPLQTLIWYPAQKSAGKPMSVADYVDLAATETSFGAPKMPSDAKEWNRGMKPALTTPLWAVRDALAASGRFPVIIYAPSFSSWAWENADLCESLASHGYVVLASPNMGATSRAMTSDVAGINAQAGDISYLIGYAQTLSNTNMAGVAVAGFSWGGLSNLFAAARDNRIHALVALDGSMRYSPGLVKQAGDVHPEQMSIPLLYFAQGEITLEDQARHLTDAARNEGPSILNSWTHGDLVTAHMFGLVHTEFSSMYQRNEDVWKGFRDNHKGDYEREDGISGYAWMARYTLQFLDAYLKHEASAMAYLKKTPAENGVPKHFMSVEYRPAKGLPGSLDAFRSVLGRQGFSDAPDAYAAMRKENPNFRLDEATVNSWAYDLMADNHLSEALDLFKLNVQIYPESSNAFDSLGEAYMKSGQKQLAIESYAKSLEKDPTNANAKEKLKELEANAPLIK